jgi:hypothetical protein
VHPAAPVRPAGPPASASNSSKQEAGGGITTKNLTGTNSRGKSREKLRHTRHVRNRRSVFAGRRTGTRPPA